MSQTRPKDSVSGLIYDPFQNKFLLLLRTANAPRDPDCWSYFGGTIEDGEGPIQALARELYEELQFKYSNSHLSYLSTVTKPWGGQATQYLVIIKAQDHSLVLGEGRAMDWLRYDVAVSLPNLTFELTHAFSMFTSRFSEAKQNEYKRILSR